MSVLTSEGVKFSKIASKYSDLGESANFICFSRSAREISLKKFREKLLKNLECIQSYLLYTVTLNKVVGQDKYFLYLQSRSSGQLVV